MVYLYDNAICKDLEDSFNPDISNPVVKVIDPENIITLAAQIQDDAIKFPLVALTRGDYNIDSSRTNFTRMHKGVATVIDTNTNELFYERVIPITLPYQLTVLTTNQADMDELIRELLFKYTNMYYLAINLPYEADRRIRFGITIDKDTNIERSSGSGNYLKGGTLYQAIIPMKCEGCVLVNYTPVKLKNTAYKIEPRIKGDK